MNWEEAKAKAEKVIDDLCHSRIDWTMRVPADPERDPDLILSAAIQAAEEEIDRQIKGGQYWLDCYNEQKEEITRLREALQKIEKMPWDDSQSPYALIARKALKM